VRFIDEMVGPLINDELYLRKKDRPNPLLQLSVSSNGDLCPDDVIRSFSTEFAATDLNVATSSYCDVESNIAWTQLRVAQQDLPSVCTNCTWKDVCGGGLLQHRYSKKNGFANPSVYCAALKKMHAHVSALLINSGYSAANIEDRLMRLSN
jgi:uncharacterized protein